jgi:hypothetical protein
LTCHIAIMRHLVTGVVSLGHFDNFCCWQKFGENSSAHKEGIKTMLKEISKNGEPLKKKKKKRMGSRCGSKAVKMRK